jgi:hypothetical protein
MYILIDENTKEILYKTTDLFKAEQWLLYFLNHGHECYFYEEE